MSKKGDNKNPNNEQGGATGPSSCRFSGCKHSSTKFGFCQPHYEMYMSGVIRGDGAKPVDFEKKFEQFEAAKHANKKVA